MSIPNLCLQQNNYPTSSIYPGAGPGAETAPAEALARPLSVPPQHAPLEQTPPELPLGKIRGQVTPLRSLIGKLRGRIDELRSLIGKLPGQDSVHQGAVAPRWSAPRHGCARLGLVASGIGTEPVDFMRQEQE